MIKKRITVPVIIRKLISSLTHSDEDIALEKMQACCILLGLVHNKLLTERRPAIDSPHGHQTTLPVANLVKHKECLLGK